MNSHVLFTRFVRRRNFRGFPFWVSASPETCAQLAKRAREVAAAQGFAPGIHLADCSPMELGVFREREILPERPVSFEGKRDFKMVFLREDTSENTTENTNFENIREHVLFGEVEHWTHVQNVTNVTIPPKFSSAGPDLFSHSSTYGFLTSNPSFAGTGLQLEAALHLPALAAGRRIPTLQKALGAMGYDLQPLSLRIPGYAESGYFRLLSRGGMDLPEETLYTNFAAKADSVLAVENGVLAKWHKREPNQVEDRVYRALRLLQEARRIEYVELLSLTSFTRIGAYLGILPEKSLHLVEKLRVRTQTFHLQPAQGKEGLMEADRLRADVSRELLNGIQPLSAT